MFKCLLVWVKVFSVLSLLQTLPVESLIKGNSEEAFSLLLWFKDFFNRNLEGQKCSTLEACDEKGLVSLPVQRPKAVTQLNFCKFQKHIFFVETIELAYSSVTVCFIPNELFYFILNLNYQNIT